MNGPVDEIRRLRGEVAERDQQLAELRGLVHAHLEATTDDIDERRAAEQAAYERGEEWGYRRGIEHALIAVEDAHLAGTAHDHHGQMRELGLHNGPVPPKKTADEIVADAEYYTERHAEWWWRESQRQPARVRELHPKERDVEREAG